MIYTDEEQRKKSLPYKFIAGTVISLCSFAVSVNTLPVMITSIDKMLDGEVSIGMLFGFLFFFQYMCFTLASLILGYASGRGFTAHRQCIILSLVLSGLCFIGLSFLIRAHESVPLPLFIAGLFLTALVLGSSGGLIEPGVSFLLEKVDRSPHKRLLQFSQVFYCVGAVLSPLVAGVLLRHDFEIAGIGCSVGVFLLLCGIACRLLFRSGAADGEQAEENASAVPEQVQPGADEADAKMAVRPLILASLMMFTYVVVEISLASWLPYYVEKNSIFDTGMAAFSLAFFWGGLAVARVIYTAAGKVDIRTAMLLHSGALLVSLLLLFFTGGSVVLLFFLFFVCGFGCGPMWPFIAAWASDTCSRKSHMIYVIAAGSIGASLGPVITSAVIEAVGLRVYFPYLSVAAACLFLVILLDRKKAG